MWGATHLSAPLVTLIRISIHAPVWGATLPCDHRVYIHLDFNPRARVGRDRKLLPAQSLNCYFNPRARVGRDPLPSPPAATAANFNPRARVGRDQIGGDVLVARGFQSTRPCGARRGAACARVRRPVISIHAPVWGATASTCQ